MKRLLQPPGGELTFYALIMFGGGIAVMSRWYDSGSSFNIIVGAIWICLGAGLWFRQQWARWGTLVFWVLWGCAALYGTIQGGLTFRRALLLLACGSVTHSMLKWRPRDSADVSSGESPEVAEDDRKPLISLVLLLKEPRYLDSTILTTMINKAWGLNLPSPSDTAGEATSFVVGESPVFIAKADDSLFCIHNHARQYFENTAELLPKIEDLRKRLAVAEHRAWTSVDLLHASDDQARHAHQRIGTLIDILLDDNCLAILNPETWIINVPNPELRQKLQEDNPLEDFGCTYYAPVVSVQADDPRMLAAVAEARDRWFEFAQAFENRQAGHHFSVKGPFCEGDVEEFMWIEVTALENDVIYGVIANIPAQLKNVHEGSRTHLPLAKLNDWIYTDGKKAEGGFTLRAIRAIQAERQAAT